jgi:hypothetical protein
MSENEMFFSLTGILVNDIYVNYVILYVTDIAHLKHMFPI